MKAFHVVTLDRKTEATYIYQVVAESERKAKHMVIAGIEAGTKKGDVVYECFETESDF